MNRKSNCDTASNAVDLHACGPVIRKDERPADAPAVYHRGCPHDPWRPAIASIDLTGLGIEQLAELLSNGQAEMAAREKHNRKEHRAEFERRAAAEGYRLSDIFPELGAASSGPVRRKRPPRYRDPNNPDHAWSGIGRAPKWVQAAMEERGIDLAAFKSIPMYRIQADE